MGRQRRAALSGGEEIPGGSKIQIYACNTRRPGRTAV